MIKVEIVARIICFELLSLPQFLPSIAAADISTIQIEPWPPQSTACNNRYPMELSFREDKAENICNI